MGCMLSSASESYPTTHQKVRLERKQKAHWQRTRTVSPADTPPSHHKPITHIVMCVVVAGADVGDQVQVHIMSCTSTQNQTKKEENVLNRNFRILGFSPSNENGIFYLHSSMRTHIIRVQKSLKRQYIIRGTFHPQFTVKIHIHTAHLQTHKLKLSYIHEIESTRIPPHDHKIISNNANIRFNYVCLHLAYLIGADNFQPFYRPFPSSSSSSSSRRINEKNKKKTSFFAALNSK